MDSEFLKEYINQSLFLQNKPLTLKEFKKECKNLGIYMSNKELEVYEQKNLFFPIFRTTNYWKPEELSETDDFTPKYMDNLVNENFINFEFISGNEENLSYYLDNNKIYPANKENFLKFELFKNSEGLTLHENYYSIFQIEFIDKIHTAFSYSTNYLFEDSKWEYREEYINHKLKLFESLKNSFEHKINFLVYIQRFYYPYTTKDFKKYFRQFDLDWISKRRTFKTEDALERFGYTSNNIKTFIKEYLDMFTQILNLDKNADDWIYFWENVNFDYKTDINNDLGLALYYLKLVIMLKYFLIDYSNETGESCVLDEYPTFLDTKNKFDKVHYLMNRFYLNSQPSLMIFVEGESEEKMFPKIFEWCIGINSTNLGIEFVNVKGVDKLKSTADNAKDFLQILYGIRKEVQEKCTSNNKINKLNKCISYFEKQNIDISNIKSLISYNLINWQIIPFFIFDDEGGIKKLLDNGKIIEFDNNHYDIPNEWKYVWGLSNNNSPLKGKDFELANFTDLEIKIVLNEILKDQFEHEGYSEITVDDISEIRRTSQGINQVCNSSFKNIIKYRKTKIVELLFDNLFKEYEYSNEDQLLNRPIFELIKKINDIRLNYPKVYDEESENYFLSFITNILNETTEDFE